MSITRRALARLLSALAVIGIAQPLWARTTPRATEGPFYPTPPMRFADADTDLVRIEGEVRSAGGEIMVLKGRVLDRDGQAAEGARVEIWQCDTNGVYLHAADRRRGGYDAAFQGFGHVVTSVDGAYAFRTIKPVAYGSRTPHIHVKVFHAGRELTTQFYLAGHPLNVRDGIFRRLSPEDRDSVAMVFADGPDGPEAIVDIRL